MCNFKDGVLSVRVNDGGLLLQIAALESLFGGNLQNHLIISCRWI